MQVHERVMELVSTCLTGLLNGQSRADVTDVVNQLEVSAYWVRGVGAASIIRVDIRGSTVHNLDPATSR